MKMKKEIASYKLGQFVDFKGVERLIVACAVSMPVKEGLTATWNIPGVEDSFEIVRAISIGIAVYNPEDEFNLTFGKEQAYKKALAGDPCWFIGKGGVVTKECIDALLTEKIDHFTKNPEIVIKDYNANKAKYEKIQEEKEYIQNASPEEQAILTLMSKGVDVQGVLDKTKTLVDAIENGSSLVD
jgi:hypothetical protein